jgi:DNA-binding NarL/FixJ family response regulator
VSAENQETRSPRDVTTSIRFDWRMTNLHTRTVLVRVLRLIACGHTNKEIAAKLSVTEEAAYCAAD